MVVCPLGAEDSKVLPMRTGTDGVGASAVGMGESPCGTTVGRLIHGLHQHLQVPCFHRVWLVRWEPLGSFRVVLYILFFLGSFFSRVRR